MTSPFPAMSVAQAHALLTQPGSMFEVAEAKVNGVAMKVWASAPAHLGLVFALSGMHVGRTFLVYENERVGFDGFRKAAATLAHRLAAEGVVKGDRVAIVMRNLPEWVIGWWACVLAGAIATPLNAWWTGQELEYGLRDSGAKLAIVDAERWERLREHIDSCVDLKTIYVARAAEEIADPRVKRLEDAIGKASDWDALPAMAAPDIAFAPDDDVTIFYTSGTTGKPKGAVITHRNIVSNMFNSASAQARAFLRRGEQPPQPDPSAPQKGFLLSVPLFHATGCFAILVPSTMQGFKIVMQRKWDIEEALPIIERERLTHVGGVPTIAWQIVEHPQFESYDLSSIESISYGGAPSAPELVKRIKERFPKVQPGQGWGMTETSATAVSNFGEDYVLRPWSCGVPSATGEVKIMDPATGASLPVGEVGELLYKGPIVVRGYWNKPGPTAETFVDGWVRTGDLAKTDEEGFITIVDRAKDMLIRGGENIYCVEVENALYEHPAVMDAAVVGIPHHLLGEEPAAIVHLKPGMHADESELRHWVSQRLAAFKVPVKVAFWAETLPRNPQGKILKRDLKSVFGATP
jgi:long-chain acyl-CoA synthetase